MRHATLPQAVTPTRPVRFTVQAVALVMAVAVITGTLLSGTASAATHARSESSFVTRMNAERREAGLGRLAIDVQLTRVARAWSDTMAARDALGHNPRLAIQVRGDWIRVGENVGYSSSRRTTEAELVARLHRAFMASPGHRANILRDYNQVGVGVTVTDRGTMWVTVVFARASLPATRRQVGQAVIASRTAFPAARLRADGVGHVTLTAPTSRIGAPSTGSRATGPTLLTPAPSSIDPAPVLHPAVRAEIDRVLRGRGTVYLIGDEGQVSARAARELVRDGYRVQRLTRTADITGDTPNDVTTRLALSLAAR